MQQKIVQFERVSLSYSEGKNVLHDISFSLAKGSFHYLMGPSGAGKSTLIKLMYLGFRGYRGAIRVFGRDLVNIHGDDVAAYRRQIGVVFQDFHLLNHLCVLDNIALPLRLKGESWLEARAKGLELLNWIGLKGFANAVPQNLSGGQKQRLAIGRAVINRPSLLIADEPTGNVDDENAVKLLYLFTELNKRGTTVIFATHNRDLALEFPQPALYLEHGELHMIFPCHERKMSSYA
ncbi:MAG: ATP-binding cassette domain-containing protein [Caedimonas sp.]|nr:ATP-binding cassette domain-containing protein [Caedimonas sp.]